MKEISKNQGSKRMPYWLCTFIVSFIAAAAAILPVLINNNGYIAMSHDFAAEEISYNILMNKAVKSGDILWNWGIDIGSNFVETFSFYGLGSPFMWIMLLFPAAMVPKLLGPVMILKFAAAGTISSVYFNRHLKSKNLVVLASVLYAFSGFQCASVVFYHFQDPVAFFPLLLIGVEKLIEDKKHGWLAFGVMVNALCNYVFFFAEVIFVIIFYVVKYLIPQISQMCAQKKAAGGSWADAVKPGRIVQPLIMCMLEGMLGVAMAGILLLPSVNGTMSNSRISQHISILSWFTMSTKNWLMLIKAFFLPGETMNACLSVEYSDWMTNAAYLPLFGAVFAAAYMISKKDWLSGILKVGLVCAVVPLLNNVFSFLSNETYRRWYFMLILFMALATAKVIEERREYKVKKAAVISGILLMFFFVMVVLMNREEGVIGIYKKGLFIASFLLGVAGPVIAIALPHFMKNYVNVHRVYVALAVVISAATLGITINEYAKATDNTAQDFKTYGASYGENVYAYLTEIPEKLSQDVLPYRYYFDEGIGYTYYNLAMTNQLPSINSFCSTVHSSIGEYYDAIGIGRATWTNAGPDGIRELLGARYVVSYIEQPDYTYIRDYSTSTGQTLKLYENENALPIGFTYDIYMTRSQFESVDNYLKPAAMLKMLIVEDEDEELVSGYLKKYDPYTDGAIAYENIAEYAQAHMGECSQGFVSGKNYFRSDITADADKYAFFAVPYDKAWKVTVNGSETQIINVNGLMAVRISQGSNDIRFDYEYKMLKYGAVLSAIGVLGCAAYVIIMKKREKSNI